MKKSYSSAETLGQIYDELCDIDARLHRVMDFLDSVYTDMLISETVSTPSSAEDKSHTIDAVIRRQFADIHKK